MSLSLDVNLGLLGFLPEHIDVSDLEIDLDGISSLIGLLGIISLIVLLAAAIAGSSLDLGPKTNQISKEKPQDKPVGSVDLQYAPTDGGITRFFIFDRLDPSGRKIRNLFYRGERGMMWVGGVLYHGVYRGKTAATNVIPYGPPFKYKTFNTKSLALARLLQDNVILTRGEYVNITNGSYLGLASSGYTATKLTTTSISNELNE